MRSATAFFHGKLTFFGGGLADVVTERACSRAPLHSLPWLQGLSRTGGNTNCWKGVIHEYWHQGLPRSSTKHSGYIGTAIGNLKHMKHTQAYPMRETVNDRSGDEGKVQRYARFRS